MDSSSPKKTPRSRQERFVDHLIGVQARLKGLIYALVADYQAAEDILQETNLVLWRKSEEFREGSSFWAWASQVARFEVRTYRKKLARDRHVFPSELLDQLASAFEGVSGQLDQRTSAMRHCLASLPPEKRELIVKRYQTEEGIAQLADDVGKSPAAVGKSLFRIRRQLLECIERELAKGEHV